MWLPGLREIRVHIRIAPPRGAMHRNRKSESTAAEGAAAAIRLAGDGTIKILRIFDTPVDTGPLRLSSVENLRRIDDAVGHRALLCRHRTQDGFAEKPASLADIFEDLVEAGVDEAQKAG